MAHSPPAANSFARLPLASSNRTGARPVRPGPSHLFTLLHRTFSPRHSSPRLFPTNSPYDNIEHMYFPGCHTTYHSPASALRQQILRQCCESLRPYAWPWPHRDHPGAALCFGLASGLLRPCCASAAGLLRFGRVREHDQHRVVQMPGFHPAAYCRRPRLAGGSPLTAYSHCRGSDASVNALDKAGRNAHRETPTSLPITLSPYHPLTRVSPEKKFARTFRFMEPLRMAMA